MWEHFGKPATDSVKADIAALGLKAWDWFLHAIPDIAGYGTIVAGGWVMLGSMVGEGASFKPVAYLAAGLIVAVCVLETAS